MGCINFEVRVIGYDVSTDRAEHRAGLRVRWTASRASSLSWEIVSRSSMRHGASRRTCSPPIVTLCSRPSPAIKISPGRLAHAWDLGRVAVPAQGRVRARDGGDGRRGVVIASSHRKESSSHPVRIEWGGRPGVGWCVGALPAADDWCVVRSAVRAGSSAAGSGRTAMPIPAEFADRQPVTVAAVFRAEVA